MPEGTLCCRARGGYCDRCDLLVGLGGLHVIGVDRDDGGALTVTVESATDVVGCPMCGVLAHAHGRVDVHLVDARDSAVPTGGAGQSARPGRPSGALAGVN
jgi:transposase